MIGPVMTLEELAARLSEMYRGAREGEAVANIHLFGIRYAQEIRDCDASPAKIVRLSGIPESYGTEVSKGIKLARYVVPLDMGKE